MANNENIVLPFKLHDHRLKPDYNVAVRLPASIAVVELVFIARCVVFWVAILESVVFSIQL